MEAFNGVTMPRKPLPKRRPAAKSKGTGKGPKSQRVEPVEVEEVPNSSQEELNLSSGPADKEVVDPLEGLPRMTEEECNSLKVLDLERMNAFQGVKLIDHEIRELDQQYAEVGRQYQLKRTAKVESRKNVDGVAKAAQKRYEIFIKTLAKKHGLDPHQMSYNVEAGTLTDLRPDLPKEDAPAKEDASEASQQLPN